MGTGAEALCLKIAARQHGLITRAQALEAKMSKDAIRHKQRTGQWQILVSSVYAVAGSPRTMQQKLQLAVLWAGDGAALSHRTAAALWRFDGFSPSPVEITVRPERARHRSFRVRRKPPLGEGDVKRVDGLPVTSLLRTIVDLCSTLSEEAAEELLDEALRRKRVTIKALEQAFAERRRPGRRGARVLARLIAARQDGAPAPESPLERRVLRLILTAGLPAPVRQLHVELPGGGSARLDLAYPEARLGIEVDSHRHHSSRRAWDRDLRRRNHLTQLGWHVLHVTSEQIREDSGAVTRALQQLLERLSTSAALGHPGPVHAG